MSKVDLMAWVEERASKDTLEVVEDLRALMLQVRDSTENKVKTSRMLRTEPKWKVYPEYIPGIDSDSYPHGDDGGDE